jgi:methionyl-tRNA formyltransferase
MKLNINLVVFASGELGLKMVEYLHSFVNINFIATDRKSDGIILFANHQKINLFIGKPNNEELFIELNKVDTKILFSINYLFILDKKIFQLFEYAINFHGSLLPKYRGRTPHIWAIINNEKYTGITAHFIEEGCDTGDIVLQKNILIEENLTGADLLRIYQNEYPAVIRKVLEMVNETKIVRLPQNHLEATLFPKRTPDDGLINWNWQKERIYNWVRALSHPYPGAFTYYRNEKLIIDKINFSNIGFDSFIENGTIISINQQNNPIVKVQNGAIEIIKRRNPKIFFIIDTKFENEN